MCEIIRNIIVTHNMMVNPTIIVKKLDGILYPEEATIAGVMEIEKRHSKFEIFNIINNL
ncbi:hypothetical protein RhiirA4_452805 [Rhizophagus irregularis]|uniref:Uncharacterized protein n=1 Tax=Rhizophagus irregularis TaxID=588596 RepID=A0A2I1FYY7_9GLOM|nr:hypothetical protein RhiirA4_452805 [Rhizophagus irregularis]